MNRITKIEINNIKGKGKLDLPIGDGLFANKPNILVAPNGYGKSTVATAIKSASHGAIKLSKTDQSGDASLDITIKGEIDENIHCDVNNGNLSRKLNLCVINDSIIAKSTGRSWGNIKTSSAEIALTDVIIVDKIPDKSDKKHEEYKSIKNKIDERLRVFNTTGRAIKSHQTKGKLVVKFEKPSTMSNGERDILLFIAMLTKFEIEFTKKVGLLVIDDIFDYLDGSNMLAVQYYISELIKTSKKKNKILFVIIFTHLDPDDFSNYYFSNKNICYLMNKPKFDKDNVYNLIVARDNCDNNEELKNYIGKYFLHYHYDTVELHKDFGEEIVKQYSLTEINNNSELRLKCYEEITKCYLENGDYDPLMVVTGLRLRIEENLSIMLPPEKRIEFYETHTTIKKIKLFDEETISELYYLLQPLYNDSLHLSKDHNKNINKLKGCKLKLDNMHIKRMISIVFMDENAKNISAG